MKDGQYEAVKAPKEFPGYLDRGRYALEHRVVWWRETGNLPPDDCVIHHKNGNPRDNRFSNLEVIGEKEHKKKHGADKCQTRVKIECPQCGKVFSRRKGQTHLVKPQRLTFCSRQCSSSYRESEKLTRPEESVLEVYKEGEDSVHEDQTNEHRVDNKHHPSRYKSIGE